MIDILNFKPHNYFKTLNEFYTLIFFVRDKI